MTFLVIFLALVAPVLTKIPLATTSELLAYYTTPMLIWEVTVLCLIGGWVNKTDKWASYLVWWAALGVMWSPTEYQVFSTQQLVFGVFMMAICQTVNPNQKQMAIKAFCVVAVIEVALVVVQSTGITLRWDGFVTDLQRPTGTLGNRSYMAAYFTMLMAVAPPLVFGFLLVGIILTKSVLGLFVSGVMVWMRWPRWRWYAVGVGVLLIGTSAWLHPNLQISFIDRTKIWWLVLSHSVTVVDSQTTFINATSWQQWLFGHGAGSWLKEAPVLQQAFKTSLYEGWWTQAHNEPIQLMREHGLLAFGLLGGWIWSWRKRFNTKPIFWSAVLNSMMMFPFHTVPTGVLGACLIGFATSKEDSDNV